MQVILDAVYENKKGNILESYGLTFCKWGKYEHYTIFLNCVQTIKGMESRDF